MSLVLWEHVSPVIKKWLGGWQCPQKRADLALTGDHARGCEITLGERGRLSGGWHLGSHFPARSAPRSRASQSVGADGLSHTCWPSFFFFFEKLALAVYSSLEMMFFKTVLGICSIFLPYPNCSHGSLNLWINRWDGKEQTDGREAQPAKPSQGGRYLCRCFIYNLIIVSGPRPLQLPLLLLLMAADFCLSSISTLALCTSLSGRAESSAQAACVALSAMSG